MKNKAFLFAVFALFAFFTVASSDAFGQKKKNKYSPKEKELQQKVKNDVSSLPVDSTEIKRKAELNEMKSGLKGEQDLFISAYYGYNNFNARGESLNLEGQHPYGIFITKIVQIRNLQYFGSLNMGGDEVYSLGTKVRFLDTIKNVWDTVSKMVPTKATLLSLSFGISVPYEVSKIFAGPVLGITTGVAFIDRQEEAYSQALGIVGLYSQVNVGFAYVTDKGKGFAGRFFARFLYNALISEGHFNFNGTLEFGVAVGFGNEIRQLSRESE
jgi:hypothetical protein